MSYFYNEETDVVAVGRILSVTLLGIAMLIALGMWGCPRYGLYERELAGRAELAQAQYNRQTAVAEAQAKLDSAKLLNQAEVERAKGVAEANRIIGESLKQNEAYLRYLWINGLQTNEQTQVIYVPTEAGLPILEAGRRPTPAAPVEK